MFANRFPIVFKAQDEQMTFYTEAQRRLQEQHGKVKLADTVERAIVWDVVEGPNKDFIESRDFFMLSSVDQDGRPTVSYKGGAVGLCKIVDPKTLVFPAYDGNGMFMSLGNIADTAKIGMLFIDFQTPNRVRIQGVARIIEDKQMLAMYPGAICLVEVTVESCFLNCARYIHKYERIEESIYVPAEDGSQPHPSWKRIDFVQDALSDEEKASTIAAGGTIEMQEYVGFLVEGKS